jgi:F0F1-type ATP synthase membrane subunit b/b'
MALDTGFWILASFLTFLACCGKKAYRLIVEALDKYRDDIKTQFEEAEALKIEARSIRDRLAKRAAQVHTEIAALKEVALEDLEERKKTHLVMLEDKTRAAEALYTEQMAVMESTTRTKIAHALVDLILQHVKEAHALSLPPSFSSIPLSCIAEIKNLLGFSPFEKR